MDPQSAGRRRETAAELLAWMERSARPGTLERLGPAPGPAVRASGGGGTFGEEGVGDTESFFGVLARRLFGLGLPPFAGRARMDATMSALGGPALADVATMDEVASAAFLGREDVIRNRRKLDAVRHAAGVLVAVDLTWGGVGRYAAATAAPGVHALVSDLADRLQLVGPVTAARLAHTLGYDAFAPNPVALRVLRRVGWTDDARYGADIQELAETVSGGRAAHLGAALLALATGRWVGEGICGVVPQCDVCPIRHGCATGRGEG